MASEASKPATIRRFSRTERTLHWVHASAFFVLLGSGLVLYVPRLSELVGRRPFVKDVHFDTGLAWMLALALVVVLGDRGLRRTLRELDVFDRDDRLWLRRIPRPQGRFNAGQKLNAAIVAGLMVVFTITGVLIYLQEASARFRGTSAILIHDVAMYIAIPLVLGHLYLALLNPSTRHSLRGMTLGSVRRDWARRHHPKWEREL
jgi:formate dehydrogenase subunit gamma